MRYYIIAGEASGDLHASNLMKELKKLDPEADFRCWGGDLMVQQGGELVRHYRDLAFMGFVDVAMNIRTVIKNIKTCKKDLLAYDPDVLILIDYPGFNMRIAEFASSKGMKVIYYISPQVWAWKKSRVYKIKKVVDKMFVILPFEKAFYARYDYPVEFVGHPLLDAINDTKKYQPEKEFRRRNLLSEKPVIALLAGSRKQEISRMLPVMLNIVSDFPDYQFVVAGAPSIDESFYRRMMNKSNVILTAGETSNLLHHAHAALVTSGTATLEVALYNVPQVVCYKGDFVSYTIARKIVNVKYISLVNLIMDREIVTELIQQDFNEENLRTELNKILTETTRKKMLVEYQELKEKLGGKGASARTAKLIYSKA